LKDLDMRGGKVEIASDGETEQRGGEKILLIGNSRT